MQTLSVSSLNEQIKTLLESSFSRVLVQGELSRITYHNSGHIYFTLKDKESAISCVLFKGNAARLKFRLEEGLQVILDGALTLYKPRGSYQINCFTIEPAGHGALALAYEQLKQKLSAQGYFLPERKKQLPRFPKRIALITSATGAALQDMLRIANTRYRAIEIDIYDVLVQGESAAFSIANAIKVSDTRGYDIIVVGRGGGSIEDLWAFNEEIVADAIYHAATPIVSAVGHEIDWVISDYVSDVRAATPSAAMQIALPDTNELYQTLDTLHVQFDQILQQKIYTKNQELTHLKNSYLQHSVEKKIAQKLEEVGYLKEKLSQAVSFKIQNFSRDLELIRERFPHQIKNIFNNAQSRIINLQNNLESNNPKYKSKSGFAQLSKDNRVVDIDTLHVEDVFELQSDAVSVSAKVLSKQTFASSK